MDAINNRTDIYAGGIFNVQTWFSNNIGYDSPLKPFADNIYVAATFFTNQRSRIIFS